ncbi:uncharacterized protein LOC127249861 [Andrographis paniculata]|uniref:uncharacterized protein LOC127249861 n=1 Tax=Andrographis paniculata TaxID=175694 RepID=UPI0021E894C0|nr:uncharacterized protein LOC127249861 [Andrographis paniculata]
MAGAPPSLLWLTLLLLLSSSTLSHSFSFSNYHTLLSLSHSLIARVATLRAARGDLDGAARARNLADNLERGLGLGFYRFAWNVGWDYLRNYAWRDTTSFGTLAGLLPDLNELFGAVAELSRIRSDAERVAWIGRNYKRALRVSKSAVARLLSVFRQSGPLRDVAMAVQKEIVEGDLLRDCLELGGDDLKGLIEILKGFAVRYSNQSSSSNSEL